MPHSKTKKLVQMKTQQILELCWQATGEAIAFASEAKTVDDSTLKKLELANAHTAALCGYKTARAGLIPSPQTDAAPITITVSPREFDTVIAALRYWQRCPVDVAERTMISCEHGEPLSVSEIDALVERINQ